MPVTDRDAGQRGQHCLIVKGRMAVSIRGRRPAAHRVRVFA
jgi:hypothetical protein